MGRGEKLGDWDGGEWEIKQVLYADDVVFLVADTRQYLQLIVNGFKGVCNRMGLKVNVGKSTLSD